MSDMRMAKVADKPNLPEQLDKLGALVRQAKEALLIVSPPSLACEEKVSELPARLSTHIERVRGLQKEMSEVVDAVSLLRDQIV